MKHPRLALALPLAAALLLTSCATPASAGAGGTAPDAPAGASFGSTLPGAPAGDVIGQGTVIDTGSGAELCLGAVAESYPPQCSGIPIAGWSWDGLDGAESAGDTTWGSYAVQGGYDGKTLTLTQPPILLALYDPMMREDPTDGRAGKATDDDVVAVQATAPDLLGESYLGSYPEGGWVWLDVVWDDGTLQQAADDDFGTGVVVVRSALTEVG